MAEVEGPTVQPRRVAYDAVTGVPSEFNEFLPKDCEEYKKWKVAKESGAVEGALEQLSLGEGGSSGAAEAAGSTAAAPVAPPAAAEPEKQLPGGKKKKKKTPEVVLERNTRNKKKCITTISGLDMFGVKLGEAAKLFGKKFASGASVNKTADGREQIDVQGDCLDGAVELILKQYKDVKKQDIYSVENKKKEAYFGSDDEEE